MSMIVPKNKARFELVVTFMAFKLLAQLSIFALICDPVYIFIIIYFAFSYSRPIMMILNQILLRSLPRLIATPVDYSITKISLTDWLQSDDASIVLTLIAVTLVCLDRMIVSSKSVNRAPQCQFFSKVLIG